LGVAVLCPLAGLAAALPVPRAAASPLTWRLSLGAWALVPVVALLAGLPRDRRSPPAGASSVTPAEHSPSDRSRLWRTPAAWRLSAYTGGQSCAVYVVLNW